MPLFKKAVLGLKSSGKKIASKGRTFRGRIRQRFGERLLRTGSKLVGVNASTALSKLSALGFSSSFSGNKLTLFFPNKKKVVFNAADSEETVFELNRILRKHQKRSKKSR